MATSIWDRSHDCLSSFRECLLIPHLMKGRWAEKQLAAFLLWTTAMGAFARGRASADTRLQEHQDIRSTIMDLLSALQSSLIQLITTAGDGSVLDNDDTGPSRNIFIGDTSPSIAPSPRLDPAESHGSLSTELPRDSILIRHSQEITDTLEHLTSLAVAIRMAGAQHRDLRAEEFAKNDNRVVSLREETLELLKSIRLSGLFREAKCADSHLTDTVEVSQILGDRLTECNVKRRSRFLYASHHDRSLDGRPASIEDRKPTTKARDNSGVKHEPAQHDVPPDIQEAAGQGMDKTQQTRTSPSQTSTAPTPIDRDAWNAQPQPLPGEHESSSSPNTAGSFVAAKLKMKYPPPPKVDPEAVRFQCPCCRLPVPILCAEKNAWRKHVKKDLRPYVCLMPNCTKPYETFSETKDWLRHMEPEHKTNIVRWTCNAAKHESPPIFASSDQFESHMRQHHPKVFTKSQRSVVTKRSGGPAAQMFASCPLCKWTPDVKAIAKSGAMHNNEAILAKEKVQLNSHIAEHLQYIALRSLPEELYCHEADSIRSRSSSPSSTDGRRSKLDITPSEIEFLQSVTEASKEEFTLAEKSVGDLVAIEDWESPDAGRISRDKYWGRVFYRLARNPDLPKAFACPSLEIVSFVDRPHLFRRLLSHVQRSRGYNPDKSHRGVVLCGREGVGKTYLALKYAHRLRRHDPKTSIFWLPAKTYDQIQDAYLSIGLTCWIPGYGDLETNEMELIRNWLEDEANGQWLIITDDIQDDHNSSVRTRNVWDFVNFYIPICEHGLVLYTTRSADAAKGLKVPEVLHVGDMTHGESCAFLQSLTGKKTDEDIVEDIIDGLKEGDRGLPTAIAEAADKYKLKLKEIQRAKEEVASQMAPSPTSAAEYTVGWICASPSQLSTAIGMLDQLYDALPDFSGDQDVYTLGRISGHRVVLACLPTLVHGASSAAVVVNTMAGAFPCLKFFLLVGIGGGLPTDEHDIRLGDVVVSMPVERSNALIQVRYGESRTDRQVELHQPLQNPPRRLVMAVCSMSSLHPKDGLALSEHLQRVADTPVEEDQLFEAWYDHASAASSCSDCDSWYARMRPSRRQKGPVVHYGTIGSSNQILKSGMVRDQWGKDHDVLCLEMDGTSLHPFTPYLMIRGIANYCDSHKSKNWQMYAAAAAAAYGKELLSFIPRSEIDAFLPISNESLTDLFRPTGDRVVRDTTRSGRTIVSFETDQSFVEPPDDNGPTLLTSSENRGQLTFRMRGIPAEYDAGQVQQMLQYGLRIDLAKVGIEIKSLAADPTTEESVATITFQRKPHCLSLDRTEWEFNTPPASFARGLYEHEELHTRRIPRFILDLHFGGFTTFASFIHPADHKFDCVAIPGYGGHPFGSFKETGRSQMWLRDFLPVDLPGLRTMVYGFGTGTDSIEKPLDIVALAYELRVALANLVASNMIKSGRSKPLILIAHGLGGVIVKEVVILMKRLANQDNLILLDSILGILFFGVPNTGLETGTLFSMNNYRTENVLHLMRGSPFLRDQTSEFLEICCRDFPEVFAFFETTGSQTVEQDGDGTWSLTGPPAILVDKHSAEHFPLRKRDGYLFAMERSHYDLVKFSHRDREYNMVLGIMSELVSRVPEHEEFKFFEGLSGTAFKRDRPESELPHEARQSPDAPEDVLRHPTVPLVTHREEKLSEDHLELISGWLQECDSSHAQCSPGQQPGLPSRVIDVGTSDQGPRLLETNGLVGRYAVLSYCWGNYAQAVLTTATYDAFQHTLPRSLLSKTHEDAVITTRKLGLRYLWIDALCIIQDSEGDWMKEVVNESAIFKGAYVTIVATSASSQHEGFLDRSYNLMAAGASADQWRLPLAPRQRVTLEGRPELTSTDHREEEEPVKDGWTSDVDGSPWNQRAWTLQEMLLSRRLLYFCSKKIYWECRTLTTSETNDSSTGRRLMTLLPLQNDQSQQEAAMGNKKRDDVYAAWATIVRESSRRQLTLNSDRLPALSGVASEFAKLLDDDQYLAGLWKRNLARELLWRLQYNGGSVKPPAYIAPTWSWASVDGILAAPTSIPPQPCSSLEIVHAAVESLQDPFGAVRAGLLTLRGLLIPVEPVAATGAFLSLHFNLRLTFHNPEPLSESLSDKPQRILGEGKLDIGSSAPTAAVGMYYLEISRSYNPSGLLLRRDSQGAFERVGTAIMNTAAFAELIDTFEGRFYEIITIV